MEAAVSLVVPFGWMLGAEAIRGNKDSRERRKREKEQSSAQISTPASFHRRATVNGGGCGSHKSGGGGTMGNRSRDQAEASRQVISENFQRLTQQIGGLLGGGSRQVRR